METPPTPTPIVVRGQAEIDALLDGAFADARYRPCGRCGAQIGPKEAICYPCSQANRARGPIYGASLAGRGRGAE